MPEVRVLEALGGGASLEALRCAVGRERPASLRGLITEFTRPLVREEPLITGDGVALGGSHQVTLRRDGSWEFAGHFRATGWPSYRVALTARLEGTDGALAAFAAQAEVHGSNEPGNREASFHQTGINPLVKERWADLRDARLSHNLQYDVDLFGTPGDILAFLTTLSGASLTLGGAGVLIVCGETALAGINRRDLVIPGTVGLVVAGGAVLVLGPGAAVPAAVAGAAVGEAIAGLVGQRPTTQRERDFADQVFAGTIPWERVLLTNLLGIGDRAFTLPGPAETILVNLGEGLHDPVAYFGNGRQETKNGKHAKAPGQLFIHELTHAWQIAHNEFTPGFVCNGATNQVGTLGGDMSVYHYHTSMENWDDYNDEQQAHIIDEWFAGSAARNTAGEGREQADYPPMSERLEGEQGFNPYFRFVRDHIRARVR